MGLFGFSDISFDEGDTPRNGPLGALVSSEYETTTLRYPADLGAYDKAHYMVFYVKTAKKTSGTNSNTTSNPVIPGTTSNASKNSSTSSPIASGINTSQNQVGFMTNSLVSTISGAIQNNNSPATNNYVEKSVAKENSGGSSPLGEYSRTKEAIALYMPDTLEFTYAQSYDLLSPGLEFAGQALGVIKAAVDAYTKGGWGDVPAAIQKSGTPLLENAAIGAAGSVLGSPNSAALLAAQYVGIKNPMLEMIYKSPNFRSFNFEFKFYPRDENEALQVQNILNKFRYHQAPEIKPGAVGFLLPPSQFDIELNYGGQINPNLPLFKTCILTNMSVNYCPNGFSAYEIPGNDSPTLGGTGMPVGIQVILQFQEILYLTKADFPQN